MLCCVCEVQESVLSVSVQHVQLQGSRQVLVPMALAFRSQRLNDRMPSTDIGAKFTFRVDEGYLDSWVLCGKLMLGVHKTSRTLTYQDGPYDKFVLLGRLEWEIQMFFEVHASLHQLLQCFDVLTASVLDARPRSWFLQRRRSARAETTLCQV